MTGRQRGPLCQRCERDGWRLKNGPMCDSCANREVPIRIKGRAMEGVRWDLPGDDESASSHRPVSTGRSIKIVREPNLAFAGLVTNLDYTQRAKDEEALSRRQNKPRPWADDCLAPRPVRAPRPRPRSPAKPPPPPGPVPRKRQVGERMAAADVKYSPTPTWIKHENMPPNRVPERRWECNEHLDRECRTRAAMAQVRKKVSDEGQVTRRLDNMRVVMSESGDLHSIPSAIHAPALGKLHNFKFVDGQMWKGGKYWQENNHGKGLRRGRLQEDKAGKPIEYVKET